MSSPKTHYSPIHLVSALSNNHELVPTLVMSRNGFSIEYDNIYDIGIRAFNYKGKRAKYFYIYECSASSFEDICPIARSYEVKLIANENNERLEHKHIIFFIFQIISF